MQQNLSIVIEKNPRMYLRKELISTKKIKKYMKDARLASGSG